MEEKRNRKPRRAGCALAFVLVLGAVLAVGLWLGRVDEASKSPCERYAETVAQALYNCHSGQNRNHAHLISICERSADPTAACLEQIETLSCDDLEQGPETTAPACRK